MIWRDLKAPEVIDDVAQNEEHRQLMDDAGYNSAAVVPLVARGRTLGALSFLHAQRRPPLRPRRPRVPRRARRPRRAGRSTTPASTASATQIAENLQRGLRPPRPAEVPGLEISVVFEAAGQGIEIGGDVYDVLPTEDGCWILIGDVAGKGSAAAGVSVAVRHSVRGLTREIDEPEEVLARVNELLLAGSTLNDFATAMLVRLRRDERQLARSRWPAPATRRRSTLGRAGPAQLGGGTVLGGLGGRRASRATRRRSGPRTRSSSAPTAGSRPGRSPPTATRRTLARLAHSLAELALDGADRRLRADAVARGSGELRDDLVVLALRPRGVRRGMPPGRCAAHGRAQPRARRAWGS